MKRRLLVAIFIFSLLGLALAVYSFLHNQSFVSGEFCSIDETFNCDIVNRGPYSKIWGVPVAFVGMVGYLYLAAAAGYLLRHPEDRGMQLFLLLAAGAGVAFSLYLTSLEAWVLRAWCLLCLTSQILIILIFGGSLWLWRRSRLTV